MKTIAFSLPLISLIFLLSAVLSAARSFDYFYFVQQWPGSMCDTKRGCCYPTTGKPEGTFTIHGLWPNFNDGSYPSSCDKNNLYNASKIKDLLPEMQKTWPTLACPRGDGHKFWAHEWDKHGTCSESILDQHSYFQAALKFQKKANLLSILSDAGIAPDGAFYSTKSIIDAFSNALGVLPSVECNWDESRNPQLYQVYLCVDKHAQDFIDCPFYPKRKCAPEIEFPAF
ncbi:hypothetical protein J5N97_006906 [Dioscorea zingiberensis]|uniref:Uncharacterized protein n=1 Tax=Dioscorea zingiberensis TaxID=325984 RepID=A0A9D5DB86_9LILI|nr:hypothetical protein J5N97_006906 [Dioscorea zingiberensis]